jgi:uncharacterized protein (DUF2336 family)
MMTPSGSGAIICELEAAIASGDAQRRAETLRKVTDLFLHASDRYSGEQIGLFDDVMIRLTAGIEEKTRIELSRRLASLSHAPAQTIDRLAHDDSIEVAGPVLRQSPQINDETIIAIARTKGQGHLLAISQRAHVSVATTDILIHRGDKAVVHSVAANDGAQFSDIGLQELAEKAESDQTLATHLLQRTDIQPPQIRAAIARAAQAVQSRMIAECPNLEANIRNAVGQSAEELRSALGAEEHDYTIALKQIDMLATSNKLNDETVTEFAQAKNVEATVAALARICDIPIEITERCLFGAEVDLPIILARAAELSWVTTRWLLLLRNAEIRSDANPENARAHFMKLHPVTAQRLMRFYRTRSASVQGELAHSWQIPQRASLNANASGAKLPIRNISADRPRPLPASASG